MSITKKYTKPKTRSESKSRYFIRKQAESRGWRTSHPDVGGDFLEENEIERAFSDIGLKGGLPDFLILRKGAPCIVVEAKNDSRKLDMAIKEACDYVDSINKHGKYKILIATGVAGEEDTGFSISTKVFTKRGWVPLVSKGAEITAFPGQVEIELALKAGDGTTTVSVPDQSEFIDAAIELSIILRNAKVEAPLRPKVIGALVAAIYQDEIDIASENALDSVNNLMECTFREATDISADKKDALINTLRLTGADFDRLSPGIGRIVNILKRLNIRAVLKTDTDFLGMFYEAFLRYGYDNNALGIVFTPRHITRLCVDLLGVSPTDKVIDIASGTGGFLVAAFDKMIFQSKSDAQRVSIKSSLYGFDTNPTIWALATLNMFFRGDGKSHIENKSCFDPSSKKTVHGKFTRAFLNPPFSQENEPERQFIDGAMEALIPGGMLAAVVKAGIFADDEHAHWRKDFLRKHTLVGMISLPEDLFYPTAAPTSILLALAGVPHGTGKAVFMSRVWNDGYEKLKGRRVPRENEQLTEVTKAFHQFLKGRADASELCSVIIKDEILTGLEWSPQQWLPQPHFSDGIVNNAQRKVIESLFQAVAHFPVLADKALSNFSEHWQSTLPDLPCNHEAPLSYFFDVENGKSSGEKNYSEGDLPYISSGDTTNSIVNMVDAEEKEKVELGALTITAFGQVFLQPWSFVARGNGGSSVRVLEPKFNMSVKELVWFAAQINLQKWRFFYARMAIKSRLLQDGFVLKSPKMRLKDSRESLASRLLAFRDTMLKQSSL
ncbi:MAG: N-6 DNA methylase [Pseudomonadota bacterium]